MTKSKPKTPGKAGRPAHRPTEATRARVTELSNAGWTVQQIADEMGISDKTLTRYYGSRLERQVEVHEPTEAIRQQVRSLAISGATQEVIARYIGIGVATLRRYYSDEMQNTRAMMVANVARSLYNAAIGGQGRPPDIRAAIFFLKTQGGPAWREQQDVRLSGGEGGPVQVETVRRVIVDPAGNNAGTA